MFSMVILRGGFPDYNTSFLKSEILVAGLKGAISTESAAMADVSSLPLEKAIFLFLPIFLSRVGKDFSLISSFASSY